MNFFHAAVLPGHKTVLRGQNDGDNLQTAGKCGEYLKTADTRFPRLGFRHPRDKNYCQPRSFCCFQVRIRRHDVTCFIRIIFMWAGPDLFQLAKHLPNMKEIREQGEIIAIVFDGCWPLSKVCLNTRTAAPARLPAETRNFSVPANWWPFSRSSPLPISRNSKASHCTKRVKSRWQEILHEIEKLNARTALLDRDPNSRLHFAQKCFLLFQPGQPAWPWLDSPMQPCLHCFRFLSPGMHL